MVDLLYKPSDAVASKSHLDAAGYDALYKESIDDPTRFWDKQGQRVDWIKPYSIVSRAQFDYPNVSIKWYEDAN